MNAMSHFAFKYSSFCFVLLWVWFSNVVELLLNHNYVHKLLKQLVSMSFLNSFLVFLIPQEGSTAHQTLLKLTVNHK